MDPDLVRPPRHRDTGGQAETVLCSYYGILRPAGLAVRRHAPADDALGLTADGGVDDAFTEGQFALHDGIVELFDVPGQQRSGVAVLRGQHKAAGVLVDPVHRAEDWALAPRLHPGRIAVGQRIQRIVQRGMHSQVRRLVQHDGERILIDGLHRDLRLRGHTGPVSRQFEPNVLPGFDPAVRQDGLSTSPEAAAVELDRAGQLGGDGTPAQKIAQQRAVSFGRHRKDQFHPRATSPKSLRHI